MAAIVNGLSLSKLRPYGASLPKRVQMMCTSAVLGTAGHFFGPVGNRRAAWGQSGRVFCCRIRPFTGYVPGGTDYTHYDLTKPNEACFTRL